MPEEYGTYDDADAGTQYVACIVCGDVIDLNEPHPMFVERGENAVGDAETTVYHFSSGDCLQRWKRQRDAGE